MVGLTAQAQDSAYEKDIAVLRDNTDLILLSEEGSTAEVAVVTDYQGRVMTSTIDGEASFGWINRELIASGENKAHMNPYGGEDRFWVGPEGGQFTSYFAPGVEFTLANWQVPAIIDSEPFELVSKTGKQAVFRRDGHLTNYSGTELDFRVDRTVTLLDDEDAGSILGVELPESAKVVGYETDNRLTNTGKEAWRKETGTMCIWILGQFNRTAATTVVVPFEAGSDDALGSKVNDEYFGKVPAERLAVHDDVLFFKVDSAFRSKIGIGPKRAKSVLGSYDGVGKMLTLIQYTKPDDATDYVKSMWELQDDPFAGDVVNSYNDGPEKPGAPTLGDFYELETSGPAAFLDPGETTRHVSRTFHIQGDEDVLSDIAERTLSVTLAEIEGALE
jgi:hypothetical protein